MKGSELMARMLDPLTDDELKKTTVVNLRKEYKKIADIYRKIVNEELVYRHLLS